ncbi:MAG TPA: YaaL family protein [Clostridia bacterium]|nr:YaaL family protein [Clostridia bacterium]
MDHSNEETEFMELIIEARNEWLQAQNCFDNASDPDLVDYAIYRLEAAKRKYIYLIKQARLSGFENTHMVEENQGKMTH